MWPLWSTSKTMHGLKVHIGHKHKDNQLPESFCEDSLNNSFKISIAKETQTDPEQDEKNKASWNIEGQWVPKLLNLLKLSWISRVMKSMKARKCFNLYWVWNKEFCRNWSPKLIQFNCSSEGWSVLKHPGHVPCFQIYQCISK